MGSADGYGTKSYSTAEGHPVNWVNDSEFLLFTTGEHLERA